MSEVKVNKISPRTNCGTVTVGDSGDSVSVTAGVPVTVNGDLKSNALKAVDGGSIISQCGTNITLGASGDTINLAAGATQSGFGRTGTVDWDTTPKTANFTAANGTGYFVNTTSGAVTMTMPSGSAGAIVSIQDYNKTFDTNNLTVAPASGEKINGGSADGILRITTEGQGLTFVYVDSTVGWKTVHENEFTAGGAVEIIATGGTITTCGNYKIHTFTGPGTFCVSSISTTPANNTVSYMVIAGGGSGATRSCAGEEGGGAGAGGFREYKGPADCYTASPLNGNPGGTAITVTATAYPITVGAGGSVNSPPSNVGNNGSNSVFSTVTSAGGGAGGSGDNGNSGGSGGGGGHLWSSGNGNSPPVSPPQGNNGSPGSTSPNRGGGGGGAGSAGSTPPSTGGNGGNGVATSITGSPVTRAGGGAGFPGGSAGPGGGGSTPGGAGTVNTGGGGGGGGFAVGGAGGSGIVVIRYKYQ
jgi:hypothetical protein